MAIIALHSAASGLSALSTSLDIIANNLANANTDGFKSSRANFQNLLYEQRAQPGTENANGDQRPTGLYVGLGTKLSGTQIDFSAGPSRATNQPLDLLIDGEGFFRVQVGDVSPDGFAYTRAGNFTRNSDGEIVLATDTGRRLDPEIVIDPNATAITVDTDGTVSIQLPDSVDPQEVGQIEISTFINPTGLRLIGENLYVQSAASGDAISGTPGQDNRGQIRQGMLEASNVDPVVELINLIRTQRAFELNSQSIQAADEILQNVSNLRRF